MTSIAVTEELIGIFREIANKNHLEAAWALIESDDVFQSDNFTGGFDATEMAFCFSYCDPAGAEHWFQVTLDEVKQFLREGGGKIAVRQAP